MSEIIREQDRPVFKEFQLAGRAKASVNLNNGESMIIINDVKAENSVMGLPINHVFEASKGKAMLSVEETLVKDGASGSYTYTDGNGKKYRFSEYFYYLDKNNAKKYIDKSEVSVDMSGLMNYNGNRAYVEYKSATGLTLGAPIRGIGNIDTWLDQRDENIRNAHVRRDEIVNFLKSFQYVTASTKKPDYDSLAERYDDIAFISTIINGAKNGTYLILPKDTYTVYNNLILQKQAINEQRNSYDIQKEKIYYNQVAIEQQIKTNNNVIFDEDLYNDPDKQKDIDKEINDYLGYQHDCMDKETQNIDNLKISLKNQFDEAERQIQEILNSSNNYLAQYQTYYQTYILACQQIEIEERKTVEVFLSNGKLYKGFNRFGELVAIFDVYQNSVVIERECDYVGSKQWLIKCIQDSRGNKLLFNYQAGLLCNIVNTKGNIAKYEYNDDGKLICIENDIKEKYSIDYDVSGKVIAIAEEISKEKNTISYSGIIKVIDNYFKKEIDKEWELEDSIIFDVTLISMKNPCMTITYKKAKEKYLFSFNLELIEYYLEEDGIVVAAERYEHSFGNSDGEDSYTKDVTIKAQKESLGILSLDNYVFEAGESITTILNQYKKPQKITYSKVKVGQADVRKTVTVEYVYDDNQRCIEEITTEKYNNIKNNIVSHKKYTYNLLGEVIKTETYVEGRELTYGKSIEEIIYDDMGNVVKSFTYNSLDSSTKFYEEKTYDETGKVVAQKSATGESETKHVYAGDMLTEEILPNGSKLAYGYDEIGNVTAISQSTIDGQSNSTERIYKNGLLVTLKSGNNEIHYAYDYKRRIKSIDVNDTKDYAVYTYSDDIDYNGVSADSVLVTYAPRNSELKSDTVETIKDKKGNILCVKQNGVVEQEYTYKNGVVDTIRERTQNLKLKCNRDDLDNLTSIVSVDEDENETSDYAQRYEYDGKSRLVKYTTDGRTFTKYYKSFTEDVLDRVYFDGEKTKYYFDSNGRIIKKEIGGSPKKHEVQYEYLKKGDHATNLVSTVRFGYKKSNNKYFLYDTITYTYDKMSNITHVRKNGELEVRYQYDSLNRLMREDNKRFGKTYTYLYDNNGNILFKKAYDFTLCTSIELEEKEPTSTTQNKYGKDLLKEYGPYTCTYDKLGNPTIYKGKGMTWECGRRLKKYKDIEISYDGYGRRIKKGNVEYKYDLSGKLLRESNQNYGFKFIYDDSEVIGLVKETATTNDLVFETFYYQKDALGNVVALLDDRGMIVVKYVYDAWGNHKVCDADGVEIEDKSHIGHLNPIRYRSYYYDSDFGFYYLKTRYYDPKVGRFINMDDTDFLAPDVINGLNLYAYCGNNPIMNVDPNGTDWWQWVIGGLIIAGSVILTVVTGGAAAGTIAAAVHTVATGAMIGGMISSTLGAVAGGLTYENGGINWSWDGAAEGFMWGAVTGAVSGAIGGLLSAVPPIGTLGYAGIQGIINSGVAASLTALQGLATNSFSVESVAVSAISGFLGGVLVSTKGKWNIIFNAGRDFVERLISELKEVYKNSQIQTTYA